MIEMIVNPGSGDCSTSESSFINAYKNIQAFIKDCEITDLGIASADMTPNDGRYNFTIMSPTFDMNWEIGMPGLPLDKVRFTDHKTQNIMEFPRLYVDGDSWIWHLAVIKKADVIEVLKDRIKECEEKLAVYEELLQLLLTRKEEI